VVERKLPSQLLQIGTQLIAIPSPFEDIIGLLDDLGSLLSQVYQNYSKSIQDALMPIRGVLISEVLTNQVDLDIQISSLASCLSKLIRILTPNPPFDDELRKKAFLVIMSSF